MRKQEGSEGWRVAHVSDVINGCAGEVIGDMADREVGSVCLLGKRTGEMNGLGSVS